MNISMKVYNGTTCVSKEVAMHICNTKVALLVTCMIHVLPDSNTHACVYENVHAELICYDCTEDGGDNRLRRGCALV